MQSAETLETRGQKVEEALEAAKRERTANAKKNADLLAQQKVSRLSANTRTAVLCCAVLCC